MRPNRPFLSYFEKFWCGLWSAVSIFVSMDGSLTNEADRCVFIHAWNTRSGNEWRWRSERFRIWPSNWSWKSTVVLKFIASSLWSDVDADFNWIESSAFDWVFFYLLSELRLLRSGQDDDSKMCFDYQWEVISHLVLAEQTLAPQTTTT